MNILPDKYLKQVFEWISLTWQFASIISWVWRFLNIDISQGSVATHLGCGRIFKYEFVANLPLSLSVKEFCKSVNICGSCGQELVSCFFLTHSVVVHRWIYNTATVTIKSPVRVRSQWCGACSECFSDSAHMRSMQDVPGKPATYGTWFSPPPKLRRHQTLSAKIWKSNDNAMFLFPLYYHCGKKYKQPNYITGYL